MPYAAPTRPATLGATPSGATTTVPSPNGDRPLPQHRGGARARQSLQRSRGRARRRRRGPALRHAFLATDGVCRPRGGQMTFDDIFGDRRVMAILRGLPPGETVALAGRLWDAGV